MYVAMIHICCCVTCTNNAVAVSLGTLRLVSKTMAQQVPTLSMVIPYLELSTKQEYLVDRIKGLNMALFVAKFSLAFYLQQKLPAMVSELSRGSNNLSAFRWNSGGSWKGRMWEQDLPNDSQVCRITDVHVFFFLGSFISFASTVDCDAFIVCLSGQSNATQPSVPRWQGVLQPVLPQNSFKDR